MIMLTTFFVHSAHLLLSLRIFFVVVSTPFMLIRRHLDTVSGSLSFSRQKPSRREHKVHVAPLKTGRPQSILPTIREVYGQALRRSAEFITSYQRLIHVATLHSFSHTPLRSFM